MPTAAAGRELVLRVNVTATALRGRLAAQARVEEKYVRHIAAELPPVSRLLANTGLLKFLAATR